MRFLIAAAILVACDAFAPAFPAMKRISPARLTRSNWRCTATAPESTTTTVQASEAKKKGAKFSSSIFKDPEVGKSKNRAYVLDRKIAGQKPDGRKTVIITGASGGIGMAAAKALSLYVPSPRRPPPSPPAKHHGHCPSYHPSLRRTPQSQPP